MSTKRNTTNVKERMTYLEYFRRKLNLSQEEFAKQLWDQSGEIFYQPTISGYETGEYNPSPPKRQAIYMFFINNFPGLLPDWITDTILFEEITI